MRFMTDVVVSGVQAMTPAPVFRAPENSAPASRLVFGQECSGSAAAAWQVGSVSGVGLAGAADLLGLVVLGGALRHGYAGELRQEPEGGAGSISERDFERDNDSTKRDGNGDQGIDGTKPASPWDFRTSSPPG